VRIELAHPTFSCLLHCILGLVDRIVDLLARLFRRSLVRAGDGPERNTHQSQTHDEVSQNSFGHLVTACNPRSVKAMGLGGAVLSRR
jgi:hypothetical protein